MNARMFPEVVASAKAVVQAKHANTVAAQLTTEADDGVGNIEWVMVHAMLKKEADGARTYREFLKEIDPAHAGEFLEREFRAIPWMKGHAENLRGSIRSVLLKDKLTAKPDDNAELGRKIEKNIGESWEKKIDGAEGDSGNEESREEGKIKEAICYWGKILLNFLGQVVQSLRQKSFRLAMVLGLLFALIGVGSAGAAALRPLSWIIIVLITGVVLHITIEGLNDSSAKSRVDSAVDEIQKLLLEVAGCMRNISKADLDSESDKLESLRYKAAGVAVQRDESFESHLNEVQQAREAWAGLVVGTYARAMKKHKAGSKEQAAEGGAEKPVKVRKSAARSRMRAALEGVERSLRETFESIDAARFRLIVSRVRREVFSGFDIGLTGDIESGELEKLIKACSEDLVAKARPLLEKEKLDAAVPDGKVAEPVSAPGGDAGGLKISQARMLLKKSLEDIERDLWVKFKGTLSATGFRFVIANERREIDAVFALNFREEPVAGNDFEEWRETHCEEFRGSATDGLTKRREAEKAEVEKAKKAEAERKRLEEAARRPPAEEGA
ncbi:hypothetical protein OS176_02500 [Xanthomonadaceae bacterium XH05]|nr:hypothetical protein [Xanthomonadaceae bacterium XH05]